MEKDIAKEKLIMRGVEMILKAKPRTMEILRSSKMSNLKTIERSSRCVKDPNPLVTSMTIMGTTYPLSIDKELAKEYKIPLKFMPQNSFQRRDYHKHSRILGTMGVLDWWVESGPEMDEQLVEVTNILLRQHREERDKFYNIDWKSSTISWGPPVLERCVVPTRVTLVSVPRPLRNAAICETLFEEYTTPSRLLSSITMQKLQQKAELDLSSKLVLSKQANILLSAMDSNEKCLPIMPGTSHVLIEVKHAIVHNNYVITGFDHVNTPRTANWQKPMENLSRIAIYEGINSKILLAEMRVLIENIRVSGLKVANILEESDLEESMEVKWLRVLFRMSVKLDHECGHDSVSSS